MPTSPLKPCSYPGCHALVKSGRCEMHVKQMRKRYDAQRGNSGQRGYDARWQAVRAIKIGRDPICELCVSKGIVKRTDIVHHIKPVEEHPELRLVMDNLMSVCIQCHEAIHGRLEG